MTLDLVACLVLVHQYHGTELAPGTGFAPGFCSWWKLFLQALSVLGLKHILIMYLFPFLTFFFTLNK